MRRLTGILVRISAAVALLSCLLCFDAHAGLVHYDFSDMQVEPGKLDLKGASFGYVWNTEKWPGGLVSNRDTLLRFERPTPFVQMRFYQELDVGTLPWYFIWFEDVESLMLPLSNGSILTDLWYGVSDCDCWTPITIPTTILLLGSGMLSMLGMRRR